jgi:hypothetical protein
LFRAVVAQCVTPLPRVLALFSSHFPEFCLNLDFSKFGNTITNGVLASVACKQQFLNFTFYLLLSSKEIHFLKCLKIIIASLFNVKVLDISNCKSIDTTVCCLYCCFYVLCDNKFKYGCDTALFCNRDSVQLVI